MLVTKLQLELELKLFLLRLPDKDRIRYPDPELFATECNGCDYRSFQAGKLLRMQTVLYERIIGSEVDISLLVSGYEIDAVADRGLFVRPAFSVGLCEVTRTPSKTLSPSSVPNHMRPSSSW